MPFTVKISPNVTQQQSQIIPDATPLNDGVMTKEQAAKLESLSPSTAATLAATYAAAVAPIDNIIDETLGKGPVVINGPLDGSVSFRLTDPSFGGNIQFEVDSFAVRAENNTMTLGDSLHRWLNVYTNGVNAGSIASITGTPLVIGSDANGGVIVEIATATVFEAGYAAGQGTLGFYGALPVPQAAHPTTLANVITLLTNLGLCA